MSVVPLEYLERRGAPDELLHFSLAERALTDCLVEFVPELPFELIAHYHPNIPGWPLTQVPHNIDDYRLVPIRPTPYLPSSLYPSAKEYKWPQGVAHYEGLKPPHMDAALGIGLIYKNEMHAISSAGLQTNGSLFLRQIQGTIAVEPHDMEKKKRSGLHGGVLWRHSLAQSWLEVCAAAGIEDFWMRGARSHNYVEVIGYEALKKGYDDVARDIGCEQDERSGDWHQSLRPRHPKLVLVEVDHDTGRPDNNELT